MRMSESIIELSKALAKFQGEVKQPSKDGTNPHFRSQFVTLDGVVAAITETASKHGLSFLQFPLNEDNKVGVKTLLLHTSGEFIEGEPVYANPTKNDPQGIGATLTYLRRYSLSAIFGITSEIDDDANSVSNLPQQQEGQQQQRQKISIPQNLQQAEHLIFTFGKHQGKRLKDVMLNDAQYINWLMGQDKTDQAFKVGINMIAQAMQGGM